jgi:hypothetical protein
MTTELGQHIGEDVLDLALFINGTFVVPALVIFGFINNLLVLIVMSLPHYKKNVTCLYLRVLAIFDTLTLVFASAPALTESATKLLIDKFGEPFCKWFLFVAYGAPAMSILTIVAITFVRFVAVVFPFKARVLASFRAAKYVNVTLFVFSVGYGSPGLIYGTTPAEGPVIQCVYDRRFRGRVAYELSYPIVFDMVLLVVLIVFNTGIFYRMKTRKQDLTGAKSKVEQDDKSVMVMVTVVTITFMILIVPWLLYIAIWDAMAAKGALTFYQMKQRYFTYTVASTCYTVNCSINFLLYVICCRKFRQDFKHLLQCKCGNLSNA